MAADLDRLQDALRAIARGDAEDALRAAPRSEALTAALRASRTSRRRSGAASRALGLAIAAALAGAVAAPLWMVARGGRPSAPLPPARAAAPEVTTTFLPLAYSAVPVTDGQILRLEVPRTALSAFGLLPPEAVDAATKETVLADVFVGEDGLARAVRFVRAPRAPGVAP